MKNKKDGVNERRGAGKILLATTLAGSAATSAMTQHGTKHQRKRRQGT